MVRWCEENDNSAPQSECACRACRRARELLVPEKLRKLLHKAIWPEPPTFKIAGPSIGIVNEILARYIMGRVPLENALVEIIERLVVQNDKIFDLYKDTEMLKPVLIADDGRRA